MASKINFTQTIKAFVAKTKFSYINDLFRRAKNRVLLFEQYQQIAVDEIDQQAMREIEQLEQSYQSNLAGLEFDCGNRQNLQQRLVEVQVEKYRQKLRWKYRAQRERVRRIEAKNANADKDALAKQLEQLSQKHSEMVDAFQTRLETKYKVQLDAVQSKTVEQYNAEKQQLLDKFENEKALINQKASDKKSAFVAKNKKRIDHYVAQSEKYLSKLNTVETSVENKLENDIVLSVSDLCMYFGGIKAVDGLTFDVKKNEIFGLIGPNGAGKTTVFNCITQFYKPTKGEIWFNTKENKNVFLNEHNVHDIILTGIVRTFQNVEVIKEVSVLDNLLISAHRQFTSGFFAHMLHLPILKYEEKVIKQRALKVLEYMDLLQYKDWLAYGLPYGILKKIEIARTLMNQPQLIIMDEPAAGLNDTETAELSKLIKRIAKDYDCSVFLVEHDMGLVMDVCDRILAISFGKPLAIGTASEIQQNKNVQDAYLGVSD